VVAVVAALAGIPAAAPARAIVATRDQTLSGRLLVAHGDNFATGAMVMQTGLRTPSGFVRLTLPVSQHAETLALAGASVRVEGMLSSNSMAVSRVSPLPGARVAAARPAGWVRSPQVMRIAVVLMHLPGSNAVPASKAAVKLSTFGATNSVADWYSQTSGNQVAVTGTVFGIYTGVRSCDLSAQLAAGATAATNGGYVASNFDHLVVVEPEQSCGFGGIGWVGQNGVFLNGSATPGVMEHELGHNLGLWHAGAYSCPALAVSAACLAEYGDPTDVMGSPYLDHGYNAEHKSRLGWIPPREVRTVAAGTQTIKLTASEDPLVAGSTEVIHLRATDGTVFSIDKRASIGYDAGLTGVWIRRLSATKTVDTALVRDRAFTPGTTFTDAVHHVTIKTLTDSGSSATVRVCVGACK
jgi:hypothetical protein